MSVELNSKISAQSGSMDADARGPKPMAGDESEVPVTQAQLDVGSVCGSYAAESVAYVAGLSFPSADSAVRSGSRARAVIGAMSRVRSDDRFRSCSSWWQGATAVGSNPVKIKSLRISAT